MIALTVDIKDGWDKNGYTLADIPKPTLDERKNPQDALSVIIKMKFAGVCGSDRGIWYRQSFRDLILDTLKKEKKTARVTGHELCGEIVEIGSKVKNLKIGNIVSADSHVICGKCDRCKNNQTNVCNNEKIQGISCGGCFAELTKLPQNIVWKTDTTKIRPEIAAIQDPFGNAVHCATKVDIKGKTIAIFGLGPIGLFLLLAAQGLGVKKIIGFDPNKKAREMAKKLGIDKVYDSISPEKLGALEVDIAFEMSGTNDALNNAILATRRGGDVILFGIKTADFVIKDYNRLIVRGITLHAVIGREIWRTWEIANKILSNDSNRVQDKIWNFILNKGKGTILPIKDYSNKKLEDMMNSHSKILISF